MVTREELGSTCCIRCCVRVCDCDWKSNVTRWPKRYATIRAVLPGEPELLTIRYDDGTKTIIHSRWGCGGKGKRIAKGARIKVYQRDNVNHVNFRMVGR